MRKFLVIPLLGSSLFAFSQQKIVGFTDVSSTKEIGIEKTFDQHLDATNVGATIKQLSAFPHALGSDGSKKVAEMVAQKFKAYGFDTRIETYTVIFPTPKTRVLELISPTKYTALLKEPALKEDATSSQQNQLPTYNAWSADGDVTAELVFVNYGVPADYELLDRMGISVKGKIVIAKYGHSWRGIKPKVAQEHGAIGCIIYSDPGDDGYSRGDVYPKGAYKNEYGVQRGSIMDMPIYPGDPLTPGVGATTDAKRLASQKEAVNLLKIPVIPISYHDAKPLLEALSGPVAPDGWAGGLPITYHVGPGNAKVHLNMVFDWKMVSCNDVIATIKGAELPDQWVVRGNHHDAWVNGANDPISGLAAMMEEAKAIGELTRTGWKPKRTLIYCAWDGEEPGLIGSTEWVEDHAKELQEKCVLYINSDGNARGYLGAGGSHALEKFMTQVASDVTDPQTKIPVLDRLQALQVITAGSASAKTDAINNKKIGFEALGSGSDFSPFLQHIAVPSLNLGFGGEDGGGEYHSIYDSYDLYRRFKDPSFEYGVALAKTAGHTALRMANADVLPFDFTNLYKTISSYTDDLKKLVETMREETDADNKAIDMNAYINATDTALHLLPKEKKLQVPYLDFSFLENSLLLLRSATDTVQVKWKAHMAQGGDMTTFNTALYKAEQQLLLPDGLPRRPWYKHAIYAPGFYTGYGVKTMPGIREAVEQRNWAEAQQQISLDAQQITQLASYLMKIE